MLDREELLDVDSRLEAVINQSSNVTLVHHEKSPFSMDEELEELEVLEGGGDVVLDEELEELGMLEGLVASDR